MKVKKAKYIFFLLLLSQLLIATSLFAQDTEDYDDNVKNNAFYKQGQTSSETDFQSPANTTAALRGIHLEYSINPLSNRVDKKGMWQQQGSQDPDANENQQNNEIKPGTRMKPLVINRPFTGFKTIMNSSAHRDELSNLLQSPLAVANITWQLTEPGVATGMHNAAMQASQFLLARYEAENNLIQKLDAYPESKNLILGAYNACVAAKLSQNSANNAGTTAPGGAAGGNQMTWVQAQAECLGEAISDGNAAAGGAPPVGGAAGGGGSISPTQPFTLADDPNYNSQNQNGSANGNQSTYILLTDYLFNQEGGNNSGNNNNNGNNGNDSMQELRNSWLNLFGDIRFDLQSGSGNQNNTNTAGGNTSSALTFAIRRIPPGQGTDGSQDNKAGPEEFYKNLVIGTYNQLLDISDKYCRHIVDGGSNQGNTQTQQGQNQNNGPQFFWTMDETQKAVQKLAVKGFIPSAAVFDSMAPYLITKVAVRSGAQSCPTVNGQKMCTQGQGTHPCDNFKNLKLGDNTGGTNNQNGKKKQLNEGQRRYFTLAQKIGLAKYLLTLMKAEQTVKKLTVGSTPNIFRKYALNLIYEAAGTDDLEGAYQKNLEELKVFLARIYKDRASLLSLRSRLRPKIIR